MPRKMLMSWTPEKKRWRKTYKKKQYVVYCSELKIPEDAWTQLGSFKAANEWWNKKKQEIDGMSLCLPEEVADILNKLKSKEEYCARMGLTSEEELYKKHKQFTLNLIKKGEYSQIVDCDPLAIERLMPFKHIGLIDPSDGIDPNIDFNAIRNPQVMMNVDPTTAEIVTGVQELWHTRFSNSQGFYQSIGKCLDDWYEMVRLKARPTSLVNIFGYCKEYKNISMNGRVVFHETMNVSIINEKMIEDVYKAIKLQSLNESTKKKKFFFFRKFVEYVCEKGLVEYPKNLKSKNFHFQIEITEKDPPEITKIKLFLDMLPPMLKLFALLALNTGMNNIDIGKLTPDQINFSDKTLIRKRVKTSKHANVPKVKYLLWDVTFDLLLQLKAPNGPLVLLDKGKPLYKDCKEGGKLEVYDRIKVMWRDHFKKKKGIKPFKLKEFRFFGSDLLGQNPQFRPFKDSFLGHSPGTVAEKHYNSTTDVTKACKYLESLFYP